VPSPRSAADLTNPFLGVELSQWLVGPIALLASEEEERAYLAARDDATAQALIDAFWARRDPAVRSQVDARAPEADRRFSEAGYLGRRTDRGALFVVYGEPTSTEYDTLHRDQDAGPLEVWNYAADAAPGLDGRQPLPRYRFVKRGDITVLYQGPAFGPTMPRPRSDRF
jgi:GWxTD domain-containing protein